MDALGVGQLPRCRLHRQDGRRHPDQHLSPERLPRGEPGTPIRGQIPLPPLAEKWNEDQSESREQMVSETPIDLVQDHANF